MDTLARALKRWRRVHLTHICDTFCWILRGSAEVLHWGRWQYDGFYIPPWKVGWRLYIVWLFLKHLPRWVISTFWYQYRIAEMRLDDAPPDSP